jgi:hypothetical protein
MNARDGDNPGVAQDRSREIDPGWQGGELGDGVLDVCYKEKEEDIAQ